MTEFSYGRDNGVIFDTYGGDFEHACMPYYDIHNDATIYGIDVAIMEGGEAGSPIRALSSTSMIRQTWARMAFGTLTTCFLG